MLLPDKTTWSGASESAPTRAHLQHLLCAQGCVVAGSLLSTAPESERAADPSEPSEGPQHLISLCATSVAQASRNRKVSSRDDIRCQERDCVHKPLTQPRLQLRSRQGAAPVVTWASGSMESLRVAKRREPGSQLTRCLCMSMKTKMPLGTDRSPGRATWPVR